MLESIGELAAVRPHVHESARYTASEYRAYCEGYYAALGAATKVATLAVERFALATKARQAEGKRKRSA